MKKILFLTKTLLAAVLLCVGQNAWGDVTETVVVNQNFDDGTTTLFTSASRMTVSNDNNVKFVTDNNSGNDYSLATYDFSSAIGEDATAVKIEFAYWIPTDNSAYYRYFTLGQKNLRTGFSKQSYSTSGAMFGMGLKRGKWNNAGSTVNYFSVNNGYTSKTGDNVLGAWARAEVYIDFSTKKISYKITDVTNTSTYFEADDVDYMDSNASYCNQIDFFDCANSITSYLDNLVITKYKDNSKVATTYTVKYQNADGTDLKDAVEYDTYVGDTYTASSTDMATFYSDDTNTKYIYKSGNTSTAAVETAASNVITLVFDEYEKISYTVTAKNGEETLETLASGNAYTDGSTNASWSKYINVDDTWYETGSYGVAITTATNDVSYTETDDVDYFFECENMTYSSTYNTYNGIDVSNGTAKTLGANDATVKTTTTIAAGTYSITLSGKKWDSKEDDYEVAYSTDGDNWVAVGNISYGSDEEGEKTLSDVLIPADSYIKLRTTKGVQTPRRYLDYLVLQKTGEVATIGSTGWTTFASPYALDLSNMTASTGDVAAYYASATSAESVTVLTTESTAVQAGEGILLKGSAGATITIPVVASGSAISGNLLVGCPTATTITSATDNYANIYVLGAAVAEFQNVKNWIDGGNTVSIPAGKAYLDASSSNGARAMRISFGDITGVEAVEAAAEAKAQDGKFIENGKIVIVKNGQKFNAAGQQVK